MPTFDELKARYMVSATGGGSSGGGSGGGIPLHAGCRVTPLIHGSRYFPDLRTAINGLGAGSTSGQFIYLTGWWLDVPFSLDRSATLLSDVLKAKAHAGVDVRVLGWVMAPEILQDARVHGSSDPNVQSMLALNNESFSFVRALLAEPNLAHKSCLNILSHPAGAVHMKTAIVGDGSQAAAYTGGIDLHDSRHGSDWHDVQTKVEGAVVQDIFGVFRNLWNEVRGRSPVHLSIGGGRRGRRRAFVRNTPVSGPSHTSSMPALPHRTVSSTGGARMHVQSLVTYPRFNFSIIHIASSMPRNQSLSFAPNGQFDVREAWNKAIGAAETYIYMEDQAFSSAEICDWMNARLRSAASPKVILVIGGNDPTAPGGSMTNLQIAINDHLLAGLTPAQIARVGLFKRKGTAFVHTKSTIIDDRWSMIGSANMTRRSLYTDVEHSVAYMDENNHAGVISYRTDLWNTHLGVSEPNLTTALGIWFGLPIGGAAPSGNVDRLRLPLPRATRSRQDQITYDEIIDPDSRDPWGGAALIEMMIRATGVGGSGSGP